MRAVISRLARLTRRLAQAALIGLLFLLMAALAWTAAQLADMPRGSHAVHATIEARQGSYRLTATAISGDESASLPRFQLMQQDASGDAKAATQPAPTPSATPAEGPPALDFQLPELLVPLAPEAGLQLSGTAVPTRVAPVRRQHRLINVMMLGSDEELSEDDFIRTDTMIIVSLNLDTGTASMLSLPRDLLVYIPNGAMGRLNTAYGLGEKLSWQPGGGFGLLRQTLFYNFGINVHYHARVNFSGFEAIIDKLGGIDIAVDCAYRDWYPEPEGGYALRTLPAGYYRFDGYDALWYARTRKLTDDFDRGRRHQQILRAIWHKAREKGLLASLPSLWAELTQVAQTDMPLDVMLRLLPHVISLDIARLDNLTLKRDYHTREWIMPDGAEVQLPQPGPMARLMQDFYLPPPPNQVALAGPSIAVFNATGHDNWDIVAAQRLRWDGYNALALGDWRGAESLPSSQLKDFIATTKGSLTSRILGALNMREEQASVEARADRDYDYQVVLGEDYQSCTYSVLPIED